MNREEYPHNGFGTLKEQIMDALYSLTNYDNSARGSVDYTWFLIRQYAQKYADEIIELCSIPEGLKGLGTDDETLILNTRKELKEQQHKINKKRGGRK